MGKVRIIGGIHRSRILSFKDDISGLRPTPDRARETLFNWLGQELTGKKCLDLFAGSGALGFEALSRNAKHITLVEKDLDVAKDLRLNQERLNASNLEIIQRNASSYLEKCTQQFDIIFVDPPYASILLQQTLDSVKNSNILTPNAVVYIEYDKLPELNGYHIVKQSKAGKVNYALLKLDILNEQEKDQME